MASFIQLPYTERLPSITSASEEDLQPIKATYWKCRRQSIATLIMCIGVFSLGTVSGWTTMSVPILKDENIIKFDEATLSSIFIIGALISGPVVGYSMIKLGRKKSTLIQALVLMLGWTLIPLAKYALSNSVAVGLLYSGRFLTGFGGAGCFIIAPVYIREICDDINRAVMGFMVPFFLIWGYVIPLILGIGMSWFELSVFCWVFPPALIVLLYWIPETPLYLLTVHREEEAKKAFDWLAFGYTEDESKRLYKRLKLGVELYHADRAMTRAERKRQEQHQKLKLTSRPVLIPLVLSIVLVFFQQSCGCTVMTSYTVDIMEQGGAMLDAKVGTLVQGLIFLVFVGVATIVVNFVKRKTIISASIVVIGSMQVMLGAYLFYAKPGGEHCATAAKYFGWIPFVSVVCVVIAYSLGLGSMTWTVISEITHPEYQEIFGTLSTSSYWVAAFIFIWSYPSMRDSITYHWTFWFYAILCLCAFFFVRFGLIETYGKTQTEVLAHYRGFMYSDETEDGVGDALSLGSIQARRAGSAASGGSGSASSLNDETSDEVMQTIFTSDVELSTK